MNCGHGFGAEPHHDIIRAARDLYDDVQFLKEDGTYNLVPSPNYTTQTLKKYGLIQENKDQNLPDMTVYSSDVLCPKNFRTGKLCKTSRTVSIHHFTASWMDEEIKKNLYINNILYVGGENRGLRKFFGSKACGKSMLVFQWLQNCRKDLELKQRKN